jgi:hypothetical protein
MRTRVACRAVAGAAAFGGSLGIAPMVRADDLPPVRLEWVAPAECPTRDDVLAGVERILVGARGGSRQAVVARAVVSKLGPGQWQVELTTRAGESEGERSVNASSCKALADAAALVLALAANSTATATSSPSPPPPPPPSRSPSPSPAPAPATATAPPAPTPTDATVAAPPPLPQKPPPLPAKPPHDLALSFSSVAVLGPLPTLAPGGEAAVAARVWRLRLEVGASYWAGQTISLTGGGTNADFSLVSAAGRVGYWASFGPFDVVPSLVVDADFMSAAANGGTVKSEPNSSAWLALGGGGWVFWRITREIALRLGLEAALPLARPNFDITQGPQHVFQPAVIEGKGAIGLELRFL